MGGLLKVECGKLNTKPMSTSTNKMSATGTQKDILGHSGGCLSGSKQEHTKLAASDLFNNPGLQNGGRIDWIEEPSKPESKTVDRCSRSSSVTSQMSTCPRCG